MWTLVTFLAAGTPGFAQADPDWQMTFEMRNDFRVRMGDYIMPEGMYRLEQVSQDADYFALYETSESADGQPIAMLDVWRVPEPVEDETEGTEARFEIVHDPAGSGTPIFQGFTIAGERWKIRDVVETDDQTVLEQWFGN